MYCGIDRRENKRIVKPITASFRIRSNEARKTESDDWFLVNFINISAGGTLFSCRKKGIGTGTLLDLKIEVSEYTLIIHCVGKVTRIEQPHPNSMFCVAIRFIDIGEKEEEMINAIVEQFLEYEDQTALTSASF